MSLPFTPSAAYTTNVVKSCNGGVTGYLWNTWYAVSESFWLTLANFPIILALGGTNVVSRYVDKALPSMGSGMSGKIYNELVKGAFDSFKLHTFLVANATSAAQSSVCPKTTTM